MTSTLDLLATLIFNISLGKVTECDIDALRKINTVKLMMVLN